MSKNILIIGQGIISYYPSLSKRLKDKGFNVMETKDGQHGLFLALNYEPSLILMGLILPSLSGEEILRELKERGMTEKIPIIVVTVKNEDANRKKCLENLGVCEYLIRDEVIFGNLIRKIDKLCKS